LAGKPKIEIEGQPYCYKCAKLEQLTRDVAAITRTRTEFAQRERGYEHRKQAFYDQHDEWRRQRNAYCKLGQPGCVGGVILTVALGVFASTFSVKLIWVGLIAASLSYLVFASYVERRRHSQFIIENPEPKFSEDAPVDNLVPTRVQHRLLESDGTRLSSRNYREEILKRDNNTCQRCGKKKQRRFLEVHHIIPRSKGGTDDPTNLITLCHHCHDRETWYGHRRAYPTTKKSRRRYW
jgi:hypothetical protein